MVLLIGPINFNVSIGVLIVYKFLLIMLHAKGFVSRLHIFIYMPVKYTSSVQVVADNSIKT